MIIGAINNSNMQIRQVYHVFGFYAALRVWFAMRDGRKHTFLDLVLRRG